MLGREGGQLLAPGRAATRAELMRLEREHGLEVPPDALVGALPVGLQQRVEILKALIRGARILILDEPTGVLTPDETDRLFDILRGLAREGVTILLITHKLREIMAVCDAVSVMRRGRMVGHRVPAETTREELAELMVGRTVQLEAERAGGGAGRRGAARRGADLARRGRRGAAARCLARAARRARSWASPASRATGSPSCWTCSRASRRCRRASSSSAARRVDRAHPADARPRCARLHLAHVPEDRQRRGLVLPFEAAENAVLGYHRGAQAGPGPFTQPGRDARLRRRADAPLRRAPARPAAARARLLGRQPAEDRAGARDRRGAARAAGRAADARRRHRRHRVHPCRAAGAEGSGAAPSCWSRSSSTRSWR